MSDISEDDIHAKSESKFSIKLKSLDSSNESQNDDVLFISTSNLLIKSNLIEKENHRKENKNDSMDLVIKKKLFSSEVGAKIDPKKSSEAKSTERTSMKVRNFGSPKKRYSIIKLMEKVFIKKEFHRGA